MRRPVIGITVDYITGKPNYTLPFTYAEAIEKAGGLPLMLPFRVAKPLIGEYLDRVDGVLLAGGDDLDPVLYGETWHANAQRMLPERQLFELAILAEIERRAMPVLGICLGSQVMNVHRGGSLIQFLPEVLGQEAFDHRLNADWSRRHPVTLTAESRLGRLLGKPEVSVNTSHKQAIKTLGRGLMITARSPDGVIEGIEDPSLPYYVGVQWHPERMHEEPDQAALFRDFVEHVEQGEGK